MNEKRLPPRLMVLLVVLKGEKVYKIPLESGISMYGHYIACKCLDISSEEEYMNQLTDIRILTNELEPC